MLNIFMIQSEWWPDFTYAETNTSVAALSLAFAGATFVPEAKAWNTRCKTNSYGTTRCSGY